jgi:putative Mg2+ transporter-C (MgtC) family protein
MVAQLQILGLVALAMGLGALIGIERELADKPAGLRTHILKQKARCITPGRTAVICDHSSYEIRLFT